MKHQADRQLQSVLSGSYIDVPKDLRVISEASQALEILKDLPKSNLVCTSLKRIQKHLSQVEQPEQLYHLSEIQRLYKCEFLSRVPVLVDDLLSRASTDLTSVDDLYFAHLLSRGKQGGSFSLSSEAKDRLLKNLDRSTLEYKDEDEKKTGVSIQTLRALELLSSVSSSDKDADSAVSSSAQKLLKQATSLNQGETTPKTFVLSSTAKYHPDFFTNEDINLAVATHAGKTLNVDQQIGMRNYFQQRAQVAISAHQLLQSLRGLKVLNQVPNVEIQTENVISLQAKATQHIGFRLVDNFGEPLKGVDSKVAASLHQIDAPQSTRDVSSDIKMNKDNNSGELKLKEKSVGKYRLQFSVSGYIFTSHITVVDLIQLNNVQWALSKFSSAPSSFENSVSYPGKLSNTKTAQDEHYLHLEVNAKFRDSETSAPSQVYLTLQKKDANSKQLSYQAYGKYNSKSKTYQISFGFAKGMEHLNGEYDLKIHASDFRAVKQEVWDLGSINLWFKEGQDEGDNLGVKDEYKPDKVIVHYFPPQAAEGNLVVSSVSYSICIGATPGSRSDRHCLP